MKLLLVLPAALLGIEAHAQSPIPATSPRAHWVLTPGVTGTPSQRRDNPGAASNDKMYVFGGRDANAGTLVHNALYEFDGAAWTLKTADNAPGSPPARGGCCVAWDFTRNKLVVFGGDNGSTTTPSQLFGDTWEWDPTTNAWTDVTPAAGPSPSPRRFSSMTWDPITTGMLLFGGDTSISPSVCTNDTWLFLAGAWIQFSPATMPPIRRQHSLVTRPDLMDIFLCAGVDGGTTPQTNRLDAWHWNGSDWVLYPTATFPHGVTANQAVYDQLRRRVVLQGGQGIGVVDPSYPTYGGSPSTWCSEFDSYTDAWTLYGQPTFNVADPVIGRISRYFAAYVPALGKVFKVSGQNPSGIGTTTATCEYRTDAIASFTSASPGCAGAAGTPNLIATQLPWLGRTFAMEVENTPANSVTFVALGWTAINLPLSVVGLGAANCVATVNPLGTFLALPGGPANRPTLSLALPNLGVLLGAAPLGFQALVLEPSTATVSNRANAVFGAL